MAMKRSIAGRRCPARSLPMPSSASSRKRVPSPSAASFRALASRAQLLLVSPGATDALLHCGESRGDADRPPIATMRPDGTTGEQRDQRIEGAGRVGASEAAGGARGQKLPKRVLLGCGCVHVLMERMVEPLVGDQGTVQHHPAEVPREETC